MGHTHQHHDRSESNIKVAFFLNLCFSIIELIGGFLTNSVAILSDAIHDIGDSLTLGLSWYFSIISKKERDNKFSYGYKRLSVLGALISSIVLVTGSIFIIAEAIPRIWNPVSPETRGMIMLAILGVLVNGIAALRLSKGHSINEKVVFTHLLEDVLGWIATLIGAIIIHYGNLPIIDPILSLLISLFILYNVYKNLRETFQIILQGTPSNIDIDLIHSSLLAINEIEDVHDCHSWTMDGAYHVLSVHLVVTKNHNLQELEHIKIKAKRQLADLGINHSTIEFETKDENCEPC